MIRSNSMIFQWGRIYVRAKSCPHYSSRMREIGERMREVLAAARYEYVALLRY